MRTQQQDNEDRLVQELQELVSLELKDILATAAEEGYHPRDVVSALELALQAEIEALAAPAAANALVDSQEAPGTEPG